FRHGSIREVAYNMLPRAERKSRHAVVARLFEERFGARPGSGAVVIAHHWQEDGDPERAIEHLMAAAEQADQAWAKREAMALYGQVEAMLPEGDKRRRTVKLKRVTARTAVMHLQYGDVEVSPEVLESATQPGKSAGDT